MNNNFCVLLDHDDDEDGNLVFTADVQNAAHNLCDELELNGFQVHVQRRYGRWQWANGKPQGAPVEYRIRASMGSER